MRPSNRSRPLPARLIAPLLLTAALLPAGAQARDTDEEADRLSISAILGQVVNNFSSSARLGILNPDEVDQGSNTGFVAGFAFDYELWERRVDPSAGKVPWLRSDLSVFGEAIHSSRVFETPCEASDPNNPSAEECEPRSEPDPNDFFKIVRDSSTLEWLGGVRWTVTKFNPGADSSEHETGVYVKLQGGFIRASEGGDDLIDNHFYGVGIEHLAGRFRNSSFEVGGGRTDLFAPGERTDRLKVAAKLYYTPRDRGGYFNFFVEGFLDSDRGPGSDDIEIYYGVATRVDEILRTLARNP